MKVINVYQQYFAADCMVNGVQRNGVNVMLIATSDEGMIRYDVGISFFPHVDETDFAVSYDAYAERTVYSAKGRRSKKREEKLMEHFRADADALAKTMSGTIDWEKPLIEARWG